MFVCVPRPPTERWSWLLRWQTAAASFAGKRAACSCTRRRLKTFPAQRETNAPHPPERDSVKADIKEQSEAKETRM